MQRNAATDAISIDAMQGAANAPRAGKNGSKRSIAFGGSPKSLKACLRDRSRKSLHRQ
jgi:hypothetical protein